MATPEQVAHLLRRTGFGIRPGTIDALAPEDIHDLIDKRLEDEGWFLSKDEADGRQFDDDTEWDLLPREWMERIMSPGAGLHERMAWFWHGHFTTNRNETTHLLMWRQHQTIRRHALGNIRELARELLIDGAMLHFLDGDGSDGESPNENMSREFLELFMLGRNAGYTEEDVRAGARILSGWWVDWENGEVHFEAEGHYDRPVTFLGTRQRWRLDDYLEAVMSMPSCAEHIAGKVHDHLASTPLGDDRRSQLGDVLRSNDWEIRPLVREILHGDDFVEARGRRTRQPVEWLAGAAAAYDLSTIDEDGLDFWQIQQTGQIPFEPPNVAGWPDDERWSSASQVMARGNTVLNWEVPDSVINAVEPTPHAILAHCGITNPSDSTVAALELAIGNQTEYDRGVDLMLVMSLLSPEFALV